MQKSQFDKRGLFTSLCDILTGLLEAMDVKQCQALGVELAWVRGRMSSLPPWVDMNKSPSGWNF